jgi:hypothetical protein
MNDLNFDETLGRAAFEAQRPFMAALAADDLMAIRVHVPAAALVALELHRALRDSGHGARLASLPAEFWEPDALQHLEGRALAAWYAFSQTLGTPAAVVRRKLPAELAQEASAHKALMLKVALHGLDDHAEARLTLAEIQSGHGYLDLAMDLVRLAELYKAHAPTLALDGKHHRPEHEAEARRLAAAIMSELGFAPDRPEINDLQRAWTLLVHAYNEVLRAVHFTTHRQDPHNLRRFGNLYKVLR